MKIINSHFLAPAVIIYGLLSNSCVKSSTSYDNWGDELTRYVVESYMPPENYIWNWNEAVFLKAMVMRCEEGIDKDNLFPYVQKCVDRTISEANGLHPNAVVSGLGTAYLAQVTDRTDYRDKSIEIYNQYLAIPRATNGGVSHRIEEIELWDDTVYMVSEFLLQMYKLTGDKKYLQEAVGQLMLHAEKLEDETTGLWYHGWDNDTIPSKDPYCQEGWAENPNRRNNEFWGRGNGWIVMTLADILELLPADDPNRTVLTASLIKKLDTLAPLQDAQTGHWYQLPVHPDETANFIESSCTAMFAYAATKAILLGLVPPEHYETQIERAYTGLKKHSLKKENNYLKMRNICEGTCVGDKNYYYGRKLVDERAYAFGVAIMFYDLYQKLLNSSVNS